MALLTLSLFLLSRLGGQTPSPEMDRYFFLLGAGLGLVLQVLVIAVQNSADYTDLGAATSGVTFFRTIGGSFGVAIFGSVFSDRQAGQAVSPNRSPCTRARCERIASVARSVSRARSAATSSTWSAW
jgi:hypothetical protein